MSKEVNEFLRDQVAKGLPDQELIEAINRKWGEAEATEARGELYRLRAIAEIVGLLRDKGLSCRQVGAGNEAIFEWSLARNRGKVSCNLRTLQRKGELNWQFFAAWGEFVLDLVPDGKWKQVLKFLVSTGAMVKVEVGDISPESRIIASTWQWFEHRGEGTEYSDLLSGCYILATNKQKLCYNFLPAPLIKWLRRDLGYPVAEGTVAYALSQVGLKSGRKANQIRLGKNPVVRRPRVWAIPQSSMLNYVSRNIVKEQEIGVLEGQNRPKRAKNDQNSEPNLRLDMPDV